MMAENVGGRQKDPFDIYRAALERLSERLKGTPSYEDFCTYRSQLWENIGFEETEGSNETRRTDRNRIVRNLDALLRQALGRGFVDICNEIAAETGKPFAAESTEVVFPFINREKERQIICGPAENPFFLVDAAAGYGKSVLLRQVKEYFEREGWLVASYDFKEKGFENSRYFWQQLIASIPQNNRRRLNLPGDNTLQGSSEESLLGVLHDALKRHKAGFLVLLDAADRLKARKVRETLRNKIYELEYFCRRERLEFRCVVAGRYIKSEWDDKGRKGPRFSDKYAIVLTPFDQDVVQDAIQDFTECQGDIAKLARRVIYVSGGHPRLIASCLGFLKDNPRAKVSDIDHNLIKDDLERTYEEIYESVPQKLHEILDMISILRWGNANFLEDYGSIVGVIPGNFPTGNDLVKELSGARLWNFDDSWLGYRDDICRRVLLAYAYRDDTQLRCELHGVAAEICERWLQSAPENAFYIPTLVVEGLYHSLNSSCKEQQVIPTLRKLLGYLRGSCVPDLIRGIQGKIRRDEELQGLFFDLTQDEDYFNRHLDPLLNNEIESAEDLLRSHRGGV